MSLPDLSEHAIAGATFAVRVTPKAGANRIEDGKPLKIRVTAPPTEGQANTAVRALLAKALGVAPTRLVLLRGAASRDKLYQLD